MSAAQLASVARKYPEDWERQECFLLQEAELAHLELKRLELARQLLYSELDEVLAWRRPVDRSIRSRINSGRKTREKAFSHEIRRSDSGEPTTTFSTGIGSIRILTDAFRSPNGARITHPARSREAAILAPVDGQASLRRLDAVFVKTSGKDC